MRQVPLAIDHAGQILRGTLYLPESQGEPSQTFPAVLLLHGFTGNRIETGFLFVQLGRALAAQGIAAVTFDFLHSGESDGSFDQMLVTGEIEDALRVSDWLKQQPFCDPSRMGLMGFSLGGLVAACVVGRVNDYQALTLLAPTTVANVQRFAKDMEQDGRIIKGPFTLHRDFFRDVETLDPLHECVKNPRPTLVVRGGRDEVVPFFVSRTFIKAMQNHDVPVEVETIDDASHLYDTPQTRKRLIDTVADFFKSRLGRV